MSQRKLKPQVKAIFALFILSFLTVGYFFLLQPMLQEAAPNDSEVAQKGPASDGLPEAPDPKTASPASPLTAAVPPVPLTLPSAASPKAPASGSSYGDGKCYKVALSQWPGHMAGVIACGGLVTQSGSFCSRVSSAFPSPAPGICLEYVFLETPDEKNACLQSGECVATWQVVDEMPLNMPGYKSAGVEVFAGVQIDWSRGGDACVGTEDINSPRDLLGRKSAMMKFSPDHTVYEFYINNGDLTPAEVASVRVNTAYSMDSWEFGRELFCSGKVDMACLWEPDVTAALACKRPDGKVSKRVFSTADARSLIADVLLFRKDFAAKNPAVVEKVSRVFMEGGAIGRKDLTAAAKLVSSVVPRFRDELKYAATLASFGWVRWNDLGDNVAFFGLDDTTPKYMAVYGQADTIWSEYKESDGTKVVKRRFDPTTLFAGNFVKPLYSEEQAARAALVSVQKQQVAAAAKAGEVVTLPEPPKPIAAEKPVYDPTVAKTGKAKLVKPVSVHFKSGKSTPDSKGIQVLALKALPAIRLAEGMSIRVEGHTDDQGGDASNLSLSSKRAASVMKWLLGQGIDPNRLASVGHGETKPKCGSKTKECRAVNRRTEIHFISAQ